MNSLSSHLFRAAALALALPVFGMCSAVQINGVCVNGSCSSPSPVTYGNSDSGSTSNGVTLGTDAFNVTTSYIVSYGASGSSLTFVPTATYTGASPSTSNDTLTIDLLATIYDNSPGTFDGTYSEHIPLAVGTGTTASGQLFVDGQGIGLVGPYGAGDYNVTMSKTLTGLDGDNLNFDYQFIFNFQPGVLTGTQDSSPTPEPAETIPAAIGLIGFALAGLRRRKK